MANLLKPDVNYDHSKFVQETLDWVYDVKQAVIHSLRMLGKESNLYTKTVYIPLVDDQRYYNLTLTQLTKELIDFVKVTGIAMLAYSDDGETDYYGPVTGEHLPAVERLEQTDYYRLAQRLFGSTVAFKQNMKLETSVAGVFDAIVAKSGTSLTLGAAPAANQYITNLEKSDQGEWFWDVALTAANPTTMTNDIEAAPYSWAVGDKVHVSTGRPMFLLLTFRAIPQLGYFTSNSTVIPCQNQFLDDIKHPAINYLYGLLSARDPEASKGIAAMRQIGANKSNERTGMEVKRRTASVGSTVVRPYNPLSTKYGR